MTHLFSASRSAFFCVFILLSALTAANLPTTAHAQENQAIGRVVTSTGSVTARDLNGAIRALSRRSDIFVGDTVITGPNGFAQLRMVDSAQISFKADTEFTFSVYNSDGPGGAADNAVMEMVRGGFRTISGTIGEDQGDDYQVTTQFANIGIRGTTHEAVIDAGALLTGVYDGGTTIANAQGSINTGENANFDYSQTFPGQPPQGLLQQPAQLGQINLNQNAGADGDDDDDADAGDEGDAGEDGNDGADDNDGNDDNGGLADADDEEAAARPIGDQDGNDNNDDGPGLIGGNRGNELANVDPADDTDTTRIVDLNPAVNIRDEDDFVRAGVGNIENDEEENTNVLSAADIASTSERIGFILSRNISPGAIFPGNVTTLESGQQVLLIGNDLTTPRNVDSSPNFIFRGDGDFLEFIDGNIVDAARGENPYNFQAGLWGSADNPVSLFTDYTDNTNFDTYQDPFIVVSVEPAPLASLTGEVVYMSNFERILGGSSLGGGISDFFTAFEVDFSAGLINEGTMDFCIGGNGFCNDAGSQQWEFDFSGTVRDGFVVASPDSATGRINGQRASIYGLIEGVFTGNNGEAFLGGFNLFYDPDLDEFLGEGDNFQAVAVGLPETLVDGIFLLEQERRATREDIESLDDDAFLVQEGYARIFLGYSRPTSLDLASYDNSIFFVDSRSRPRIALVDPDFDVDITRIDENLPGPLSNFFDVNWERWDGPLLTYTDNLDTTEFTDGANDQIHDIAYFARFEDAHLQDVTGHYDQVLGFVGENGEGTAISMLSMEFDINFSGNLQNITNGRLEIETHYNEGWLVFFEGDLIDNIVEFDLLASGTSENTGIYDSDGLLVGGIDTSDSNMQGVIVSGRDFEGGENPALLSSFYFREDSNDPNRARLSGLALVGRDDISFVDIGLSGLLSDEQLFAATTADNNGYTGMINIPGMQQNQILETGLGLDFESVESDLIDVFFMDLEGDPSYNDYAAVFELNQSFSEFGSGNIFSSSNANYFLQMAAWNDANGMGDLTKFATMSGENFFDEENFNTPVFWNNFSPTEFSTSLNGRFSTVLEAFGIINYDNQGAGTSFVKPIDQFSMEFDVDFGSGFISNGNMHSSVQADDFQTSGIEYNWMTYFNGVISGGETTLTPSSVSFVKTVNGDSVASYDASYGMNNEIIADFTGDTDTPILTGSYFFDHLELSPSTFYAAAAGNFATTGIVDARLSTTEMFQMEHHVGMIIDGAHIDGGGNLVPGSISFGLASHPAYSGGTSPVFGINDRGMQVFEGVDLALDQPFDEVLTGTSSANVLGAELEVIDSEADLNYQIALGYWDSGDMTVMHNQLDNMQTSSLDQEIFWANVIPADISELTGTNTFTSTGDYIGNGSSGQVNNLSMSFMVNFDTSTISGGSLNIGDMYSDEWNVAFSGGNINGSLVQFTGITGNYLEFSSPVCSNCVTGQIGGIFAEDVTGEPTGFAAGFTLNNSLGTTLEDFVQGAAILTSDAL